MEHPHYKYLSSDEPHCPVCGVKIRCPPNAKYYSPEVTCAKCTQKQNDQAMKICVATLIESHMKLEEKVKALTLEVESLRHGVVSV